jgi:hypothetical protein
MRRLTVDWYRTRDEALDAEATAIFSEQPKYNVKLRNQAQRHVRAARAGASYAEPKGEDLSYLDDPANLAVIEEVLQAGRQGKARRDAGLLTKQEQENYEFMRSLNSGLGDGT